MSASLTAVELVRAISAVVQPIAVLGVVVAGPISTRPLSTRWIVCKKEKIICHDFSPKFFFKFASLSNCVCVDVESYCSCSHQNCPHSPSHGHICIWQGHTDHPDRWTGLSRRFDHLCQDHHGYFILRRSQLLEQLVYLPINVSLLSLILTMIISHITSSFFIWAIDAVLLSITDKSQKDALTTFYWHKEPIYLWIQIQKQRYYKFRNWVYCSWSLHSWQLNSSAPSVQSFDPSHHHSLLRHCPFVLWNSVFYSWIMIYIFKMHLAIIAF